MILTAEEDGEHAYAALVIIDVEIEDGPLLGDRSQAREKIGPQRPLMRRIAERQHCGLYGLDPRGRALQSVVPRVAKLHEALEQKVENRRQIPIGIERAFDTKSH